MKHVLVGLLCLLLNFAGNAQAVIERNIKKNVVSFYAIAPISLFEDNPIIQYPNGNYLILPQRVFKCNNIRCGVSAASLFHLLIWPVNKTAGTFAGVHSIDNEIPNIRGAGQTGTAYYIDGVRVRSIE